MARDLLGQVIETNLNGVVTSGRILETEAYVGPHDPAAHGYRAKKTKRNSALFGPPGISYVYFTYGMHWCANAVTESEGFPAAVLIRALQPLEGVATMQKRRGTVELRRLCSGPAKLCQALGITGDLNARLLDSRGLRIVAGDDLSDADIGITPRIGISKAVDWPLRFVATGSPWLSRPTRRD